MYTYRHPNSRPIWHLRLGDLYNNKNEAFEWRNGEITNRIKSRKVLKNIEQNLGRLGFQAMALPVSWITLTGQFI
ncbi:MAG: hypothetical protein WCA39_08890 [Nitrososphaeraceae archaeon]